MPTIEIGSTSFTFSILPPDKKADDDYAKIKIAVQNEFIAYEEVSERFFKSDVERIMFCLNRLLAGAYGKSRDIELLEQAFTLKLVPYTEGGEEVDRKTRRENECSAVFSFLFLSKDKKRFLDGVYLLTLGKQEIKKLASGLWEEYKEAYEKRQKKWGRYLFIGVSPKGYKGCNYWYMDTSKKAKAGDYVWVRMGKRDLEQIVYVDSVRYCGEDDAPYPLTEAKKILRLTTEEERAEAEKSWNEN